jgi:hypothetical protein
MISSLSARSKALWAGLAAILEYAHGLISQGRERGRTEPSPILCPIAGAGSDESLILELLAEGDGCLDCLVSTTRLPMRTVTGALRQLSRVTTLTVGLCARCGEDDRVLCRLARPLCQ